MRMLNNELDSGDPWRGPYRGSRYTYNSRGIYYRIPGSRRSVQAADYSDTLQRALLNLKPYGSFRITEGRHVLTKVLEDARWVRKFVCDYDGSLRFTGVSLNPDKTLRPGDLWTGFYFEHGARFSLGYYDEIFCHDEVDWSGTSEVPASRRAYVIAGHEKLLAEVRAFRPTGGRFYVNEHGKVWSNSDVMIEPRRGDSQVKNFTALQKEILEQRLEATKLYPVYVCDFQGELVFDVEAMEGRSAGEEEGESW